MRTLLLLLLLLVFFQSAISGIVLAADLQNSLSASWLREAIAGITIENPRTGGIWLLGVLGGMHLVPAVLNFRHHRNRFRWAMAGSVFLLGWIFTQVFLSRHSTQFQLLLALTGTLSLLLSYTLEKEEEKTHTGGIIIRTHPRKKKKEAYQTPLNYDAINRYQKLGRGRMDAARIDAAGSAHLRKAGPGMVHDESL
jgi:hypothetical protein